MTRLICQNFHNKAKLNYNMELFVQGRSLFMLPKVFNVCQLNSCSMDIYCGIIIMSLEKAFEKVHVFIHYLSSASIL